MKMFHGTVIIIIHANIQNHNVMIFKWIRNDFPLWIWNVYNPTIID